MGCIECYTMVAAADVDARIAAMKRGSPERRAMETYFQGMSKSIGTVSDISGARVLAVLGDSITTDHISPAGNIKKDSPAGKYLMEHGVDPKDLRFIAYADHLPDMYGNALFVTRELYGADPRAVAGMVRAFNRGLRDTVADPDAAIDALARRATIRRDVDRTRLVGTLRSEMAHAEGARLGVGDMDDERLGRLIDLIVRTRKLPRKPALREVFDRRFLPPPAERITSLARR